MSKGYRGVLAKTGVVTLSLTVFYPSWELIAQLLGASWTCSIESLEQGRRVWQPLCKGELTPVLPPQPAPACPLLVNHCSDTLAGMQAAEKDMTGQGCLCQASARLSHPAGLSGAVPLDPTEDPLQWS